MDFLYWEDGVSILNEPTEQNGYHFVDNIFGEFY